MRRFAAILVVLSASSGASAAPFDPELARKELRAVALEACGRGGRGELRIVFEPDGSVSDVEVRDGAYTDATITCLERLFRGVKLAAFEGEARTITWRIELPAEPRAFVVAKPPLLAPKPWNPRDWESGAPVPPGFHLEPRRGPIVAGVIVGTIGASFLAMGLGSMFADRKTTDAGSSAAPLVFTLMGSMMVPLGGLLVAAGYGSKRPMRDEPPTVVPMIGLGRIGLAAIF